MPAANRYSIKASELREGSRIVDAPLTSELVSGIRAAEWQAQCGFRDGELGVRADRSLYVRKVGKKTVEGAACVRVEVAKQVLVTKDEGHDAWITSAAQAVHETTTVVLRPDAEVVVERVEHTDEERHAHAVEERQARLDRLRTEVEVQKAELQKALVDEAGNLNIGTLAYELEWSLVDKLAWLHVVEKALFRVDDVMASEKRVGDLLDALRYVEALALDELRYAVRTPTSRSSNGASNMMEDAKLAYSWKLASGELFSSYGLGGRTREAFDAARVALFGEQEG